MGTSPGRHIGAEADRRTSHDYHGPVWDPVAEVVVPEPINMSRLIAREL